MKITGITYRLSMLVLLFLIAGDIGLLVAQNSQHNEEQAKAIYINGIAAFEQEDYQQALTLLRSAYKTLPEHAGINFALADTYLRNNDLGNAEYYANKAVSLDPQNLWYRLKLAKIYQANGKTDDAIESLNTALQKHPNNTKLLRRLAEYYRQDNKLEKANTLYNRLLYLQGERISLRIQRLRNFNRLEMRDSSLAELQKIRALDPQNPSILRLISEQYMKMNNIDEARRVLLNARQQNLLTNSKSTMLLADIYMQQAQWDSAGTLLNTVMDDTSIAVREKLKVGRQLYQKAIRDSNNTELQTAAQSVIQQLMQNEQSSSNVQSLAADFFVETNQPDLALQALKRTNELNPFNDTAWKKRLKILFSSGKVEETIAVGEKAAEHIPQNPVILYFLGNAQRSAGQYGQAITNLKEATLLPARTPLKTNILSALADSYAAQENWNKAFQRYEEALRHDPQNAVVLNNYAYYLSKQKQKLQKAEEMAKKAFELDPDNPSYLHTLGWVKFQKQEYQKAKQLIRSSLEARPENAEAMEHLGDTLFKLRQDQQAVKWWKKALEEDPARTHLKEKISANRDS
ncbi:Tetratricopeptide repeat-containing protein [Fodinibius salinus]|uniref:Tetratricopeptide repeat-containing protein n=1 Tax=Fodinibius salinus TaxID=860790 RepID=A0A5D3YK90_9BACT|nr:tetratricopeptide repeat protein [Fodinibius salinus]TYP93376.1 Tetratricopeptide repeat-containing protein [Fodinibius salinus]